LEELSGDRLDGVPDELEARVAGVVDAA
jgi:hypothetical protein